MADVRPFRALRYDAAKLPDAGAVLAPPYDVISPAQQQRLYDIDPHNIIRIEYPKGEADPYAAAAAALREWRAEGVLVRDDQPSLYRYEQRFTVDGTQRTRRALFARVRLEPWERGVILPHEHTLTGPKDDRLRLLRACRTNVSPVYGLYRDDGDGLLRRLEAARTESVLRGRDILGHEHELARIDDDGALADIAAFFAGRRLYIADGHHRYETALAYRDETRAARSAWTGEEPENFVLMALTSIADTGLVVLPIHRLVHREPLGDLRELLDADFHVRAVGPPDAITLEGLVDRIGVAGPQAFGLVGPPGAPLRALEPRGDAPMLRTPADRPDAWRRLDVSVLQAAVLERCFGIGVDDVAAGEAVSFTEDADEALGAVLSGEARYAFLLNPTRVEQMLDVADAGARMPQKSTYFYPKLGTGLALNPFDD